MCGVFGFFSTDPNEDTIETIKKIAVQSKIRGLHSFGVSYYTPPEIQTFKTHKLQDLLTHLTQLQSDPPNMLIGHARYSTSGDWQNHANNQPIQIENLSLVFNGVISMALREENVSTFGLNLSTENDGEIFARKVLNGDDWVKFIADGKFSFAGAFLYKGGMQVIRNKNRPLKYYTNTRKEMFIASTEDIIKRALGPDTWANEFKEGVAHDVESLFTE